MAERFLRQRIDDDEVWVDLDGGRFYGLNETGAAILAAWRDGVRDPMAIAHRLHDAYDAPVDRIRREIASFLADAQARGLLEA